MSEKNMTTAIIISVILTGLGIAYAGNIKKGVTYFGMAVILNILGFWVSGIFSYISILVWAYGIYQTYLEVNAVNGN